MATGDKLIQVKDLKKYYNRGAIKALDGVTVDIDQGDVMVVIGPSGSGKSTFLRSLNLLEQPTGGSIFFDGVDITKPKFPDKDGKLVKVDIDHHRQTAALRHAGIVHRRKLLEHILSLFQGQLLQLVHPDTICCILHIQHFLRKRHHAIILQFR